MRRDLGHELSHFRLDPSSVDLDSVAYPRAPEDAFEARIGEIRFVPKLAPAGFAAAHRRLLLPGAGVEPPARSAHARFRTLEGDPPPV